MRWGVVVFFVVVVLVVALSLVEDVPGVVRTSVSSVVSTYTVTVTSVETSTVTSVPPVTVTHTVREVVYGGSAGSSVSVVTVTKPFTVTVTSTITAIAPGARGSDSGLLFLLAGKSRGVVVSSLEAGGARVYSTSDGFIVVSYSGGLDSRPLFWVEGKGGCRVYFVTWIPGGLGQVGVSWLYTDGHYSVEAYSVGDLTSVVERLGCGKGLYVVFVDKMCRLSIDGSGAAIIDGCERVNVVSPQSGHRGKSLLEALADYVNSTSINYVYHTVFDAGRVEDVLWGAWRLLEWVDKNVVYDSSKPVHVGVYDPVTFVRRGSGVCSDYSVFIAAGLIGISGEALVFAMNTSIAPHAAPGLVYDGALLVLDQHLPIVEFQDYVEYLANLTSSWVYVYHMVFDADKNASRIVLSRVPVGLLLSIYPDTWPRDNIDDELLVKELGAELASMLGASFTGTRECSSDRTSFVLTLSGKVFRLYTPVLREQWAAWLAERIIETLRSSMGYSRFSGVCIEVLDEGYGVRVYFYR